MGLNIFNNSTQFLNNGTMTNLIETIVSANWVS